MAQGTYYLTIDKDRENGGYIAVISLRSPQKGDSSVTVCDVERVATPKAAKKWYRQQMKTKPWIERH